MTTIVTRAGKGSPLTNAEGDANFTNLNNDKMETSARGAAGGVVGIDSTNFRARLTNALGTFTNFLTNSTTAVRTWTFPDKDGTIAMIGDVTSGLAATAIKTGAYNAVANDLVRINSTGGVFTVTLPSTPTDGDVIGFLDVANGCYTNPVLIAAAGSKTVEGDATGLSLDMSGAHVILIYNSTGNNWKVQNTPFQVGGVLPLASGGTGGTSLKTINGQSVVGAGDLVVGGMTGFRNRIINGDMRFDQRSEGASVNPLSATITHIVDMVSAYATVTSKLSFQRVADAPVGFKYSLRTTVNAQYAPGAAEQFTMWMGIEGQNLIDFSLGTASAQPFVVSFYAKASVAGSYPVWLQNASSRGYVTNLTLTTSWARYSVALTGDTAGTWATDNTAGLLIGFDLGSGANYNTTANVWQAGTFRRTTGSVQLVNQTAGATLHITGVQVELGAAPTTFEVRPYGVELSLCQRYYEKSYTLGVVPGTNTNIGLAVCYGSADASGYAFQCISYKTPKRAPPAVIGYTESGTSGQWGYSRSGLSSSAVLNADFSSENSFRGYVLSGASAFAGAAVIGHWTAASPL